MINNSDNVNTFYFRASSEVRRSGSEIQSEVKSQRLKISLQSNINITVYGILNYFFYRIYDIKNTYYKFIVYRSTFTNPYHVDTHTTANVS